ncbi:hypothetical protein QKQ66_gp049 [Dione juno nucleopolyhedrovirus]|uniref:Uncharacterized protein n=1 Tax=Dione juno nucleopolyhedrovirus TaxID=2594175 RepID=A0AAE6H3A4_9ABAC|nr:hypothetical protein QKQ66_gp049 [Dione juno nucleopolyhedrovirus]QDL57030.1 hypothetical protein DijuNPV-ORF-49 [Dione juno nucleopolyhedrovirus]
MYTIATTSMRNNSWPTVGILSLATRLLQKCCVHKKIYKNLRATQFVRKLK